MSDRRLQVGESFILRVVFLVLGSVVGDVGLLAIVFLAVLITVASALSFWRHLG